MHEKANYSTYMRALLGGELTQEGYTQLAIQYYFVYGAIEAASDRMAADPVGGEFVFDELRRLPHLERDLAHLVGPDWRSTISPLASTRAYVARIGEASSWAGGYVAHHYTRYLGDIAGGQAIRRLLEKKYDVAEAGTLFYHFDGIGSAPALPRRIPSEAGRRAVGRRRARPGDRRDAGGVRVQRRGVRRAGFAAGRVPRLNDRSHSSLTSS